MQKKYVEYVKKIQKKGIKVIALTITGFESDNLMSLLRLIYFTFKINPYGRTLSRLTPFPASQLYFDLLNQNRISNQNWRKYDLSKSVFRRNQDERS